VGKELSTVRPEPSNAHPAPSPKAPESESAPAKRKRVASKVMDAVYATWDDSEDDDDSNDGDDEEGGGRRTLARRRRRGAHLDFCIDGTRESRCRWDTIELRWCWAWGEWTVGTLRCVTLSACDR
jgi:hypothetical protein